MLHVIVVGFFSTQFVYPCLLSSLGEKAGIQQNAMLQEEKGAAAGQSAKPAEPQEHTELIGCLSGPDANGKYTLHSMSHRTGVEVFGAVDLKDGSGSKVKLTGSWKPGDTSAVKGKESRKFHVSEIEVLGQKCQAPSEKTPVSKEKQQKQQEKQKSSTSPAPGGDANPK